MTKTLEKYRELGERLSIGGDLDERPLPTREDYYAAGPAILDLLGKLEVALEYIELIVRYDGVMESMDTFAASNFLKKVRGE